MTLRLKTAILLAAGFAWVPALLQAGDAGESVKTEVAAIRVLTANVFDPATPGENAWPFRLVNSIHVTTRQDFLLRAVPIEPGARVSDEEIREAERILRRFTFLRFVQIRRIPREDGRIDLEVATRDAWTTKVGISYGGGGGESRLKVGLEETNLFGLGKLLAVQFEHTAIGTTKRSLAYEDPRFFDSNRHLKLEYLNNSDGNGYRLEFGLPLLRGADPFGYSINADHITDELPIYHDGKTSSRVSRHTEAIETEAIWTLHGSAIETLRAGIGFAPRSEEFETISSNFPDQLPRDIHRADITLFVRRLSLRFRSEAYINRFSRIEDIPTGLDLAFYGGLSPRLLAGQENVWLFGGHLAQGFDTFNGNFGTARLNVETRSGGSPDDRTGKIDLEGIAYIRTGWPEHSIALGHIKYDAAWRLPPQDRYLLGGDTGLRGYKAHAFDGDRSLLMNFEYRVNGEREYFKLVQIGGVAFLDTGLASNDGVLDPGKWKSAIGLGLRFGIPRSAKVNILRLDVAYPFSSDARGKRGYVVSFGSGQAF